MADAQSHPPRSGSPTRSAPARATAGRSSPLGHCARPTRLRHTGGPMTHSTARRRCATGLSRGRGASRRPGDDSDGQQTRVRHRPDCVDPPRRRRVYCTPNASWTRHELPTDHRRPRAPLDPVRRKACLGGAPVGACSHRPPWRGRAPRRGDYPALPTDAEIYLPMSSGTTGRPRGPAHRQVTRRRGARSPPPRADRADHQVSVPLCHLYGATMTLAALSVRGHRDPVPSLRPRCLPRHRRGQGGTVVTLAGPVLHRLAERDDLAQRNLKSLRLLHVGAARQSPATAGRSRRRPASDSCCLTA